MPALNTVKQNVENGYYHVYNRGVEKRTIFLDHQDYVVFLRLLKEYLLPKDHHDLIYLQGLNPRRKARNYSSQVKLLTYCLMPNHFHLFVKQDKVGDLKEFMRALMTNFVMYFNHKYDRVGPLFQGIYKAVLIQEELYFLHISRYIHRNALPLLRGNQSLSNYQYSSYQYFLSGKHPDWLEPDEILAFFRSNTHLFPQDILSYQAFVEEYESDEEAFLGRLRLD